MTTITLKASKEMPETKYLDEVRKYLRNPAKLNSLALSISQSNEKTQTTQENITIVITSLDGHTFSNTILNYQQDSYHHTVYYKPSPWIPHKTPKLTEEGLISQNLLHGKQTTYYENGKPESIKTYQIGKLNGLYTAYDQFGNITFKEIMENDRIKVNYK